MYGISLNVLLYCPEDDLIKAETLANEKRWYIIILTLFQLLDNILIIMMYNGFCYKSKCVLDLLIPICDNQANTLILGVLSTIKSLIPHFNCNRPQETEINVVTDKLLQVHSEYIVWDIKTHTIFF